MHNFPNFLRLLYTYTVASLTEQLIKYVSIHVSYLYFIYYLHALVSESESKRKTLLGIGAGSFLITSYLFAQKESDDHFHHQADSREDVPCRDKLDISRVQTGIFKCKGKSHGEESHQVV